MRLGPFNCAIMARLSEISETIPHGRGRLLKKRGEVAGSTSFGRPADPSDFSPFVHPAKLLANSRCISASARLIPNCTSSSWLRALRNFLQAARLLCFLGLTKKIDRGKPRQRKNHYHSIWKSMCQPALAPNLRQSISRAAAARRVIARWKCTEARRRQCSFPSLRVPVAPSVLPRSAETPALVSTLCRSPGEQGYVQHLRIF